MKYKRKLIPVNISDLPAMENWLEDMAAEGLFIFSFYGDRAKFQIDKPKKLTYRIDIPEYFDTKPEKKMAEMYEDFGWYFVCTYFQSGFIFCNEAENPVELYTDPVTQSEGVRRLYERGRNELLACIILLFIALLAMSALQWVDLAESLTKPIYLHHIFFWLYAIGAMLFSIRDIKRLKKTKTQLEMGIPLDRRKTYKKSYGTQICFLLYFVTTIVIVPAIEIRETYQDNSFSINEVSSSVPFVSLGELDGTGTIGETDITYQSTALAPVQYNIYTDKDNASLHIYYMETRHEKLSPQAMKTIAANGRFDGLNGFRIYITGMQLLEQSPLDIPTGWFDDFLYYEDKKDDRTYFTAYKGNKVIAVKYAGTDDLTAHLEKFSALLDEEFGEPQLISN